MILRSELSGFRNKKAHSFQCSKDIQRFYKGANVQNKSLKDLQKAWWTIAQDHFKRLQQSLAAWRENVEKWGLDQDCCAVLYLTSFHLWDLKVTSRERIDLGSNPYIFSFRRQLSCTSSSSFCCQFRFTTVVVFCSQHVLVSQLCGIEDSWTGSW